MSGSIPTTFFINNGQLYAYVNQTSVLHVNVIDPSKSTAQTENQGEAPQVHLGSRQVHTAEAPHREGLMKVELGTKKEGLDGTFYYVLDALYFGLQGKKGVVRGRPTSNGGLWWVCEPRPTYDGHGGKAVYVNFGEANFQHRTKPSGCEGFTLHSFGQDD